MKRSFILLVFVLQFVCATVAQTDWQTMYDDKVIENTNLKQKIHRLQQDSTNLEERCRAKDAQNGDLREYKRKYESIKIERDSLDKELKNRKEQSSKLLIYEDSIQKMNKRNISLNTKFDSLKNEFNSCVRLNKKYYPIYEQHEQFIKWLNTTYSSTTIDKLYKDSSKELLLFSKDLYNVLNKNVPSVIQQTIECFEAKEQCSQKFDKTLVDMKRALLLKHNSKTSKDLASQLEKYATVYAEADSLWNAIKTEVCKEEIVEESFSQIQSKRQIWQRTQKFLNKYPNLAHDYPYIYEELQKMLREIWKNANNFNKIPAPFK